MDATSEWAGCPTTYKVSSAEIALDFWGADARMLCDWLVRHVWVSRARHTFQWKTTRYTGARRSRAFVRVYPKEETGVHVARLEIWMSGKALRKAGIEHPSNLFEAGLLDLCRPRVRFVDVQWGRLRVNVETLAVLREAWQQRGVNSLLKELRQRDFSRPTRFLVKSPFDAQIFGGDENDSRTFRAI